MDDLAELRLDIPMQNIFTVLPAPNERIVLFITCADTATQDSETYAITVVARDITIPGDRRTITVASPEGAYRPITLHKLFDAQNHDPVPCFQGHIYTGERKTLAEVNDVVLAEGRVTNLQLPFPFIEGRQITYFWAPENAETLAAIKNIWAPKPPAKKKGGKSKKRRSLRKRRRRTR